MRTSILISFLSFSIALSTSSCTKVLQSFYGMKPHIYLDNDEIQKAANKFGIESQSSYVIDTSYRSFLLKFRQEYTSFGVENHLHPLQAIYYNSNGSQKSFQSGVYADNSLFNFLWNQDKQFNKFPPRTSVPTDTMFNFEQHLSNLRTMDGKIIDINAVPKTDYNVVIHWSRFAGRQTKRFVKIVQRNALKYQANRTANFFYVNTDNLYIIEE